MSKNMKILLIHPNFHCGGAELAIGTMTPLGLLYLGGSLIESGHKLKLLDAARLNLENKDLYKEVGRFKPDAVCVGSSASTPASNKCLTTLKIAKEVDPEIITVYGGVHPTFLYDEIMKNNQHVDFIVRGEGEITVKELFGALEKGTSIENIEGLVWRKDEEHYVVNADRKPIEDLDSIRAAWELIDDWELYRNGTTREITVVVQFSRGCPFSCTFCGQWRFWKKYRCRDPKKFVDELEYLNRECGVTYFFYADENPAVNQKKWLSVLNEVVERNLDVHMILNLKVTDVIRDREYLHLYKKAGIVHVDLGVECVEQEYLDKIRKGTRVNENKLAIELLKEHGIAITANLFVGDRNETKERLKRKFKIIRSWNPDFVLPYFPVPFPWTEFYRETEKEWIRTFNYEEWNYVNPVIPPENYDINEMMNDLLVECLKFALHPKKLFEIFVTRDGYRRKFTLAYIIDGLLHWLYQKYPKLNSLIEFLHEKFHGENKQPIFPLFGGTFDVREC